MMKNKQTIITGYQRSSTEKDGPLRISPKYDILDWSNLDLTDPAQNEEDWQFAVDIFEDRIRGRFLDVVDRIQKMEFSGFSVMAIDCLLIETLDQFVRGVPFSKNTSAAFHRFLKESNYFKDSFSDRTSRQLLYNDFRNGIFHQAELKGASRVRIYGEMVSPAEDGPGLVINRRLFHKALVWTLNEYICALRNREPVNIDLRWKFRGKMDYICREPQFYFNYRKAKAEDIQHRLAEYGPVRSPEYAVLNGWDRVKKIGRNNRTYETIQETETKNVRGQVYQINVYQLDKLARTYEARRGIFFHLVESNDLRLRQPVWVFRRG